MSFADNVSQAGYGNGFDLSLNFEPYGGSDPSTASPQQSSDQSASMGQDTSENQLIAQLEQDIAQLLQLLENEQNGGSGQSGDPSGSSGAGGTGDPGGSSGAGGSGGSGGTSGTDPNGNGGNFVQNASFSDTGDPHQSGSLTQGNGQSCSLTPCSNMQSHQDLLHSRGADGVGMNVSSQTTQPDANGVTYNQSINVNTPNAQLTMTKDGLQIADQGKNVAAPSNGQTIQLSDGTTVSNDNGKYSVTRYRPDGQGQLSVDLSSNGKGVDMTANAKDVNLGGWLPRTARQDAGVDPKHHHHGGHAEPQNGGQPNAQDPSLAGYLPLYAGGFMPATSSFQQNNASQQQQNPFENENLYA